MTEVPGTTRDVIDDWTTIKGVPVRVVDTAGMRNTRDPIERLGVEAANEQAGEADLVVVVIDGSCQICDEDRDILLQMTDKPGVVAVNKCDLKTELDEAGLIPYGGGVREY